VISDSELLMYLLHMTEATIQALFSALSVDGTGSISRDDWHRAVKHRAVPAVAHGLPGDYDGEFSAAGKRDGRGPSHWTEGDVYEGEYQADQREGRGSYAYADGAVYDGEWRAGEGAGTFTRTNGDVHAGEWRAGKKDGLGSCVYADGRASVGKFRDGIDAGDGVSWSADRQRAWQLRAGKEVAEVCPDEARELAARLGLPVPPSPRPVLQDLAATVSLYADDTPADAALIESRLRNLAGAV
jgi:hypothetical protein